MRRLYVLIILLLLVCTGILAIFPLIRSNPPYPFALQTSPNSSPRPLSDMSIPSKVSIPSLAISTSVIAVGKTTEGDMDTPPDNTSVGWYKMGSEPGDVGSAVLAAHTGPPDQPSPFRQLASLRKNDTIEVQDITKTTAIFKVEEISTYTPESAPRERIFGKTSDRHLAFITCTGTWEPQRQTYSHRLVVYAARTAN